MPGERDLPGMFKHVSFSSYLILVDKQEGLFVLLL